jgi:hypothetical protein
MNSTSNHATGYRLNRGARVVIGMRQLRRCAVDISIARTELHAMAGNLACAHSSNHRSVITRRRSLGLGSTAEPSQSMLHGVSDHELTWTEDLDMLFIRDRGIDQFDMYIASLAALTRLRRLTISSEVEWRRNQCNVIKQMAELQSLRSIRRIDALAHLCTPPHQLQRLTELSFRGGDANFSRDMMHHLIHLPTMTRLTRLPVHVRGHPTVCCCCLTSPLCVTSTSHW